MELPFSYSGITHEKDLETRFVELAKSISPNIQVTLEAGKSVSPPPGLNNGDGSPVVSSAQPASTGKLLIRGPAIPCQQAYIKSLVLLDRLVI